MNVKIRVPAKIFRGQAPPEYYSVYCTKSYYNIFPATLISDEILLLCKLMQLMFKFFDEKIP